MTEFLALTIERMLDFVYSSTFSHYDVDFPDMVNILTAKKKIFLLLS
jgi:hypothetical protein